MPQRIQRQRRKGWKMPPGAVYVGRPTKYGNPYRVGFYDGGNKGSIFLDKQRVIALYRLYIQEELLAENISLDELVGKDLACWCPLSMLCHADVLLELANGGGCG